ncbi:HAMP domain-containing protein [Oleiharenicola lentus]|uniref:histidine kinase n=1 Tax=Oleiharenicola lentus TaxID=2508720 RepID=A0A4Q1C7F8_9BACT|nr:ATP-binding protein [Oleiharenicola lentus]RXK54844.1 HAMP domain-containing protein [Oleiharenicola lentus]
MKLQTKLLAGFAVVSGITLLAAGIGYWQTRKLSAALYEVGTVRLPGSRALAALFEAKTALDASKRELMRGQTLLRIEHELAAGRAPDSPASLGPRTDPEAPDEPMDWREVLAEEIRRQERSWERADKAWREYSVLPKTPVEAEQWQAFTVTWADWRTSYEKVMRLLAQAAATGERVHLAAAHEENQQHLFTLSRDSRTLLLALVDLNEQIAAETKEASIASRHDAAMMQRFMLVSAGISVAAAFGAGLLLCRMISQSLRPMVEAFTRIAAGDRDIRVPVLSRDEIGAMAGAMNGMVTSLSATESARKHASDRLSETADRLELALQTSRLGVWRRNLRTDESEWDRRMFDLFGLPPAAAGPDRPTILGMIAPEDRSAAAAYWSQIPKSDVAYHFRLRIIRADGQRRHLEINARVQDVPGEPGVWLIGVVADITDIVEAAAESARLRERLAQAKNMEALGARAASVAHDFNNLLTSIKGFIDLAALSLEEKHESADLLRRAQAGARSARDLVQRLLRQARNAGDVPHVVLDPVCVAQEALALAAAGLPVHISHRLKVTGALPTIRGDAGSLQRVLLNLCTNAAHAIGSKPGLVQVTLSLETLAADLAGQPGCKAGRYVCVAISDDGCGMDAATMQRIFEAYYTTKPAGQGTGLGLAIVSDIIAEHQGGLTVESRPGAGSTFRVYLPGHAGSPV